MFINDVVQDLPEETPYEVRDKLLNMLKRNSVAFQSDPDDLGRTDQAVHRIDTGNHSPIKQRFRWVPPYKRRIIDDELNKMLRQQIIVPSNGPWASPIVLVRKGSSRTSGCDRSSGSSKPTSPPAAPAPPVSWRVCLINSITKKDA